MTMGGAGMTDRGEAGMTMGGAGMTMGGEGMTDRGEAGMTNFRCDVGANLCVRPFYSLRIAEAVRSHPPYGGQYLME